MNISRPVTQAISVLGATPQTYQPKMTKIIPAIHFVLRNFLNLTFLSLILSDLDSVLKFSAVGLFILVGQTEYIPGQNPDDVKMAR